LYITYVCLSLHCVNFPDMRSTAIITTINHHRIPPLHIPLVSPNPGNLYRSLVSLLFTNTFCILMLLLLVSLWLVVWTSPRHTVSTRPHIFQRCRLTLGGHRWQQRGQRCQGETWAEGDPWGTQQNKSIPIPLVHPSTHRTMPMSTTLMMTCVNPYVDQPCPPCQPVVICHINPSSSTTSTRRCPPCQSSAMSTCQPVVVCHLDPSLSEPSVVHHVDSLSATSTHLHTSNFGTIWLTLSQLQHGGCLALIFQ